MKCHSGLLAAYNSSNELQLTPVTLAAERKQEKG